MLKEHQRRELRFNFQSKIEKKWLFWFKINSQNSISVTYEKNTSNFEDLVNYLKKKDVKIEDISTEDGDLEDVFVKLTKH